MYLSTTKMTRLRCVENGPRKAMPWFVSESMTASTDTGAESLLAFTMTVPSSAHQIWRTLPAGQEKPRVAGQRRYVQDDWTSMNLYVARVKMVFPAPKIRKPVQVHQTFPTFRS